jgi:hypothetical protein
MGRADDAGGEERREMTEEQSRERSREKRKRLGLG